MAITDPFAAYIARDSIEAHFICNLIRTAGIDADVVEDVSDVGVHAWSGVVPGIHRPQVWIERSDADRVKLITDDYEQRVKERRERKDEAEEDIWAGTIRVVCDECEQTLSFPAAQRGTVEICPRCGRHVDVEESADGDAWWLAGGDAEEPSP